MRELERDLPSANAAAQPPAIPALAVVGPGRVGSSIAAAAAGVGVDVRLAGRDDAVDACRDAEAVLLCVPDAAIREAAGALAAAGAELRFAGHTSGASGLDALAPLAAAGAEGFSVHPLQTVPDARTDFTGCPAAVSGSTAEALGLARGFAERLGMRPFEIPDDRRAAYHAAACIASNFLVALEESAAGLLGEAGAPDPRDLLAPVVLRTAANWSERGADALTGPIARGDEETVERHLRALRDVSPELVPLYEALAERTRDLARRRPR